MGSRKLGVAVEPGLSLCPFALTPVSGFLPGKQAGHCFTHSQTTALPGSWFPAPSGRWLRGARHLESSAARQVCRGLERRAELSREQDASSPSLMGCDMPGPLTPRKLLHNSARLPLPSSTPPRGPKEEALLCSEYWGPQGLGDHPLAEVVARLPTFFRMEPCVCAASV